MNTLEARTREHKSRTPLGIGKRRQSSDPKINPRSRFVSTPESGYQDATPVVSDDGDRNLLKAERSKSQTIAALRELSYCREELARAKEEITLLEAQNSALRETKKAVEEPDGEACIYEIYRGVVSEITDEHVVVTYAVPSGELPQIYDRNQFIPGAIPGKGDHVEAHVRIVVVKPDEEQGGEKDLATDLAELHEMATTEPIQI